MFLSCKRLISPSVICSVSNIISTINDTRDEWFTLFVRNIKKSKTNFSSYIYVATINIDISFFKNIKILNTCMLLLRNTNLLLSFLQIFPRAVHKNMYNEYEQIIVRSYMIVKYSISHSWQNLNEYKFTYNEWECSHKFSTIVCFWLEMDIIIFSLFFVETIKEILLQRTKNFRIYYSKTLCNDIR